MGLQALAAFSLAAVLPLAALAQTYPDKPVRFLVPYPPGGGTDVIARIVQQKFAAALGQQVNIENRGGAGGSVGTEMVAKSAPDGYTVVAATNSIVANPAGILRSVNYDPLRDFTPITRLAGTSYVLVMAADQPLKTLDELVAHARANPGKLNYASGNLGGVLYGGMLQKSIGVNMVHVPYKSTPPALLELLSGRVHLMFTDLATASGQVKAGKVRALLATATQRTALFPDVPTIAEAGLKGFADMPAWWALYGPAGMPADAVERLNREITTILQRPDIRSRLLAMGIDAVPSTPQGLAEFTREQSQNYVRLIKEFNIQPE